VLAVERFHHAYTPEQLVVANISFDVKAGEIVSIVGPSGCGKTTLLKALAGLIKPTGGTIRFQGKTVQGVPDGFAIVFQEYGRSLLPWTTVNGNIELPLRYQSITPDERRRRVAKSLQAVDLSGFGERYPWQLSGGMQQRVAIARALAYQPKLLLMDEPFASLDAQTRADLEDLVAAVRDQFGITIVLVTHDIDESVYLSDRVIVLSHSPSSILAQINVGLPRPRDQIKTKATQQFVEKRSEIAQMIRRPADAPLGEDPGRTTISRQRRSGQTACRPMKCTRSIQESGAASARARHGRLGRTGFRMTRPFRNGCSSAPRSVRRSCRQP
jgi:NitT/TauT family transport system ATP-binding protein